MQGWSNIGLTSPSIEVSITSFSSNVIKALCVDHFNVDGFCLIYFMDSITRFFTAPVVEIESKALHLVIIYFEESCTTHFWYPEIIRGDKAIPEPILKAYMYNRGINFQPVPLERHSRNSIESTHADIRTIYIRLREDNDLTNMFSPTKAISLSNDIYGNSLM